MKIFSVFDCKASFYLTPFFCRNSSMATRDFSVAVQDEGSMFNRHPEDFMLCEVGEFDELSGRIKATEWPVPVCSADSLLKVQKVQGGDDE